MNTHRAYVKVEGDKDKLIAGGTEKWCVQVLTKRQEAYPETVGYVREITEDELR